jgi:hypothetical protein
MQRCSVLPSINLLPATRWIRSVVASDYACVGTLLTSTVGPSGRGRGSYLEATDGAFAEESWSWGRSDQAGEGNEKGVGKEHREEGIWQFVSSCRFGLEFGRRVTRSDLRRIYLICFDRHRLHD